MDDALLPRLKNINHLEHQDSGGGKNGASTTSNLGSRTSELRGLGAGGGRSNGSAGGLDAGSAVVGASGRRSGQRDAV